MAGNSELESSSRRGGFWSGVSSWSRRFLPSSLAPESRAADTSIPDVRSRSSLGGGRRDRYAAGTRRASTGTPPVPDSGHGRYADRYATGTRRASTGTPPVPQGQVTSTPRRAGEGQAPGTPFPIDQPGCSSVQLAHPAASIHDVQPPYGVRRVELFPPALTGAPVAPAGALPLPACTFQVPAGTAAPYGLYGTASLAVPPTMVSSYTAPLVCQHYPTGTYTGMGLVATTAVNYGGSAPYLPA